MSKCSSTSHPKKPAAKLVPLFKLRNPVTVFAAFVVLAAVALALGWNNQRMGASADMLFDDTPDDNIVGLQLTRD